MEPGKHDITDRDDVKALVDKFYKKVNADELLSPVFAHVDWAHHLPIMYNFWSSTLLGEQSYRGNPLQNHIALPIKGEHFERWLHLFTQTIDENFEGDVANEAKMRANSIAGIFQFKMGLTKR